MRMNTRKWVEDALAIGIMLLFLALIGFIMVPMFK